MAGLRPLEVSEREAWPESAGSEAWSVNDGGEGHVAMKTALPSPESVDSEAGSATDATVMPACVA